MCSARTKPQGCPPASACRIHRPCRPPRASSPRPPRTGPQDRRRWTRVLRCRQRSPTRAALRPSALLLDEARWAAWPEPASAPFAALSDRLSEGGKTLKQPTSLWISGGSLCVLDAGALQRSAVMVRVLCIVCTVCIVRPGAGERRRPEARELPSPSMSSVHHTGCRSRLCWDAIGGRPPWGSCDGIVHGERACRGRVEHTW